MANYRVVLEIEVNADTPLGAAKTVAGWLRTDDGYQYYVQEDKEHGRGKIFSVDLMDDDEDAVLPANDYTPLIQ